MPRKLWVTGACLVLLLGVAACGAQSLSANPGDAHAGTPEPTITPWPTYTPKPLPPTPTNVPAGWQVYAAAGTHFSIAYPAGQWSVSIAVQGNSTPNHPSTNYIFTSTDPTAVDGTGVRIEMVINETDGESAGTIQQICQTNSHTTPLANLPMRYSASITQGRDRVWVFVTDRSTTYGLQVADATASADIQAQDDQILATFRPEYTTPGCA